jgi:hypothetical protein
MNVASAGLFLQPGGGCSAATAAKVMPMIVSARVVKTESPFFPSFMRAAVPGA